MQRFERSLKFLFYRTLKWRYYENFGERMREMAGSDPFAISREYLEKLISFVREHNSYYAKFLSRERNHNHLPILTKDSIRDNLDELQSSRQPSLTYMNSSGGSTGKPVTLIQDVAYSSWGNVTKGYYFRKFLDVEMNSVKSVWLWGSERDTMKVGSWTTKVALFLQNRLLLNTFDTSEQRCLEYIERIRSYRPHYVAGYAGSLYRIAQVARKFNVRLYSPRFIHSSAEMLRDFMRKEIEEQFNAKVYDFYGSREVGAIAGECSAGRKHVFIMNNLVEVLNDANEPVDDGEEGKLIITNLHNFSMPLIRYEIGDTGAMSSEHCVCGSLLPILKQLTGRITDHFRLQNGDQVHGEFFTHLFYFRDWVNQFQVEQVDYDHLRISIVCGAKVKDSDVASINASICSVMGKDCVVEWLYVDAIKKTPQGKHLFTHCLIDK